MDKMKNTACSQLHLQKQNTKYYIMKRAADIGISLAGIVLLSPVLAVTAAAVKLYDGGNVLYSQIRLTQNGKPFRIYKFRSMRMDSEKDGIARIAQKDDQRITPVGKMIRRRHIDELPQLFNILKGDMSLVGPRPERPEIMEKYMQELPEFSQRLQVKAGLTGYAQIYGTYYSTPSEKLEMDMTYVERASLLEDFRLLLATGKILLVGDKEEQEQKKKMLTVSADSTGWDHVRCEGVRVKY